VEVARKTASRVVYMENGHIVEQGMRAASRIRNRRV
jgi:ABC-type arginine transport system ATPase subunit